MIDVEDVRRIALSLPGSFEQASFEGRPSWRTKPRMFAWLRSDPEALVLWVQSVEDKSALVAAQPQTYFTTDHYDGHPVVLVRLSAIEVAEAAEMITDSWRLRAPKRLVASWREPGQSSD